MLQLKSQQPAVVRIVAAAACLVGMLLLAWPNAATIKQAVPDISLEKLLALSTRPPKRETFGASHVYVLTASADRLREMTKMLQYGGIDFTAHWGPDIKSESFNQTYRNAFSSSISDEHDGESKRTLPMDASLTANDHLAARHHRRRYRIRPKYALACLLGHLSIWQDAVRKGYERVLVLEDDVDINVNAGRIMEEVWRIVPEDWDILMLSQLNMLEWWSDGNQRNDRELVSRVRTSVGFAGYIIRKSALPKIIEEVSNNLQVPIDLTVTTYMVQEGRLKSYAVSPPLVQQVAVPSIIQGQPSEVFGEFRYNGMAFSAGAWNGITVQ